MLRLRERKPTVRDIEEAKTPATSMTISRPGWMQQLGCADRADDAGTCANDDRHVDRANGLYLDSSTASRRRCGGRLR